MASILSDFSIEIRVDFVNRKDEFKIEFLQSVIFGYKQSWNPKINAWLANRNWFQKFFYISIIYFVSYEILRKINK
jgi:hypothetical protein